MAEQTSVRSGGIGLAGAVFIVFLVLKLIDAEPVASWSWWWVTAPLWIPLLVTLGIVGLTLAVCGVAALVAALASKYLGRQSR